MLKYYRQLYGLLNERERKLAAFVFLLLLAVAIVEAAGVASLFPFMAVLSNPEVVETNRWLAQLYSRMGFETREAFLVFMGFGMFFVLIGSLSIRALGYYVQMRFSSRRHHALSLRLLSGYLHQPYQWFLNRNSSELSTKVLGEAAQAIYGALFPAMQILANCLVVAFLVVLLVFIDPILAATTFTCLGSAYFAIVIATRRKLNAIGNARATSNEARYQAVQEGLGGIKDVKIAGLESVFIERFRKPSEEMASSHLTSRIIGELPAFAMQGLVFGGMLIILLYLMISKGSLEQALPTIAVYALAGYRLMPAMQAIYAQISELRYNEAALESLFRDVATLSPVVKPPSSGTRNLLQRVHLRDRLELKSIEFSYPDSPHPALRGLSLSVHARTKVGLVGASGSGKTTTVDLILGLLQPSCGEIVVDGITLNPNNMRSWQRNLGYVPQQIYLTDESVAGNIAFGVPPEQIDMLAVERAARVANLHDFVIREMPNGYSTPVGERGVRLSGGQRQRIGIARALYHDPEVLILDEATSALDNLTERAVMEAVDNLGRDKTIILIAHRLSTVQSCDCIHFLEGGMVAASGTFSQLLESHPTFRSMAGEA